MKVTISVQGRFWAFNLANQLEKKGHLERLITSYPKFETVKYGIPREKIRSVLIKEIMQRGWKRMPATVKNLYDPNFFISDLFDKLASAKIIKTDIFAGYSSVSLHSLRKAKKLGAIIVLEHGSSHPEYQRDILKEEYENHDLKIKLAHPKLIEKELREFEETDYIYIPSKFVKRTFLEKGIPEKKLIHIPFGVDLSQFKQVEKKDDVFRVVFAGGMVLRKGVHYLLQAFSELNLPNSELMLLGAENDEIKPFFKKYNVKSANKPGRGDGEILHFGNLPQRELYKYYSQGSVFTMMSIEEGLAMVQPQAMACGLPVICTTNTGGEDIVREGKDGFIIPIRDVEALKEKLVYLYENPGVRDEMSKSAKERVSSGFTWDDYGERIINEYKRILKAR